MKKQSSAVMSATLIVFLTFGIFPAAWFDLDPRIPEIAWASSTDGINPTITAVTPLSTLNDLDTTITITGADFAAEMAGTEVISPPTVSLGESTLSDVTWVDSTTITAKVTWGFDPGNYQLTVVNPDGGTGSLANAFTINAGIGQWNGGQLFGGQVNQLMMKPNDPDTLYASAYGIVGLFRSKDAGEHWTHIGEQVSINNGRFAIDPLHPGWIYGFANGLMRSQDEGDTWTTIMSNSWPDGRTIRFPQAYVSPHDPQDLFVGSSESYGDPNATGAVGLIKSADGGASWQIVADMEGLSVQSLAFHPSDYKQAVLATSNGRVFQSNDGGDHWSEVTKPGMNSLGVGGLIVYNPYRTSEVWIASMTPGNIFKSTDAAITSWDNVTPSDGTGSWDIKFASADSVYTTRHHTGDGGLTWEWFAPITSYGELVFVPGNPQIGYIGDDSFGVQKTTDGGETWEIKNQGLTGMRCNSLEVSSADPLRIYATFGDGMGIYRSTDGAANWTYLPVLDAYHMGLVREDPFDPQRIYAESHSNFYTSLDGGETWSDLGWNASPPSSEGMILHVATDPHQAGHLLSAVVFGKYGNGNSILYTSSDYAASWQAVTLPQEVAWTTSIVFDPEIPGLVYIATNGTGVYRSMDSGTNWSRIDDPAQQEMEYAQSISIATSPQHILFIGSSPNPYRSLDNGATWTMAQRLPMSPTEFMFAGDDSSRLYLATSIGLYFSPDVGDTWTSASGALGRLQIQALGFGYAFDHTILYAATSGGATGNAGSLPTGMHQQAQSVDHNLVDAGIYRYVQHEWRAYLPSIIR